MYTWNLPCKIFYEGKIAVQVHRHVSHKESVTLAFWKLNLTAIHK